MKRLSDTLGDFANSGVYVLQESSPAERVATITKERGLVLFHIEGQDIRDKDQFLKQVATALSFPEYFGNNWDAIADCLTDMSWHDADGFVILYDHFDPLAEHSPLGSPDEQRLRRTDPLQSTLFPIRLHGFVETP